jgi:hypothetical protein
MEIQNYILADDADYDQFSGTLVGISVITAKLKQLFKFKHIPLVLNDNWQGALTKAYGIADNIEKKLPDPYCYLKVSSFGVRDDAHNLNQSMRNGTGFNTRGSDTGDLSNALLDMQYFAWAKVNIELCVGFRNPIAFFAFCEKLSIAIRARRLSASANFDGNVFDVYADPQQSEISPTMMTTDDATTAGWLTLNHALTVHTQFGTSIAVAKLNNEGIITNNVEVIRE